jgi:hypothetical protein
VRKYLSLPEDVYQDLVRISSHYQSKLGARTTLVETIRLLINLWMRVHKVEKK